MNLHEDREKLNQAVLLVAETLKMHPAIVEKDYFVTLILKKIVEQEPHVVFKGGTSLSKCYKAIHRFSEDLDLSYDNGQQPVTQGMRRRCFKAVRTAIKNSNLRFLNEGEPQSKRVFNKFLIDYGSTVQHELTALRPHVQVETSFQVPCFPIEIKEASSYIYQYFEQERNIDVISQYGLEPFRVKVQTLERTFVDKVFAVCDYYLSDDISNHSRHLYDLHKLFPEIETNRNLVGLIREVRSFRAKDSRCLSARGNCNINDILGEIIERSVYKNDYDEMKRQLLFEDVPYNDAIETLRRIMNTSLFVTDQRAKTNKANLT